MQGAGASYDLTAVQNLHLVPYLKALAAPIFIRLSGAAGLCQLLRAERSDAAHARQIDGFGLIHTCCPRDLVTSAALDATARALHDAYRKDLRSKISL